MFWRLRRDTDIFTNKLYVCRVSNEILLKNIDFYEKQNSCKNKSLLASFLQSPNVNFKDIIGMIVDILMAAIDTVSLYALNFLLSFLNENITLHVFTNLLIVF